MLLAGNTTVYSGLVEIRHLEPPIDPEKWQLMLEDADRAGQRVPGLYSDPVLEERAEDGRIAFYEISNNSKRLGSMALELAQFRDYPILNVVWLTIRPGHFGRAERDAVLESWRKIAKAADLDRFMIVGRPGWEHVLESAGLRPKELSRFWVFKTKFLPDPKVEAVPMDPPPAVIK